MSKVKSAILPYLNESLDVDSRVKDLLERLTLEEKFQIISGHMLWWTNANKQLKIPEMGMSDGPRGISLHSSYRKNTQFPPPIMMAATWDRQLFSTLWANSRRRSESPKETYIVSTRNKYSSNPVKWPDIQILFRRSISDPRINSPNGKSSAKATYFGVSQTLCGK